MNFVNKCRVYYFTVQSKPVPAKFFHSNFFRLLLHATGVLSIGTVSIRKTAIGAFLDTRYCDKQ